MNTIRTNWESALSAARLREFEVLTRQTALTSTRIAELMGVPRSVVSAIVTHARDQIHIKAWDTGHNKKGAPMYAWGVATDVSYPTAEEQRLAAGPADRYDSRVARRDASVAMLFGTAHA